MILLDLRMHGAGVDNPVRLKECRIALQRHAAPGTAAWRVNLHAFAHWAEVFLWRLTQLRRCKTDGVTVLMAAATGACGGITVSVSFHQDDCTLLEMGCRDPRTVHAVVTLDRCDLLRRRRLAGLGKLFKSIKLLVKHAFYKRRHLLKSALDESPNAIRKLEASVVGHTCQLPGQGSSNTGCLQGSERS